MIYLLIVLVLAILFYRYFPRLIIRIYDEYL